MTEELQKLHDENTRLMRELEQTQAERRAYAEANRRLLATLASIRGRVNEVMDAVAK